MMFWQSVMISSRHMFSVLNIDTLLQVLLSDVIAIIDSPFSFLNDAATMLLYLAIEIVRFFFPISKIQVILNSNIADCSFLMHLPLLEIHRKITFAISDIFTELAGCCCACKPDMTWTAHRPHIKIRSEYLKRSYKY